MISVDVCKKGAEAQHDVSPDAISDLIRAGEDKGAPILWVDVASPTEEDWKRLEEEFHFHPLALEDARQQGQRAKVDTYDGYFYLVIKAWKPGKDAPENGDVEEIDVFLGRNYLVTIHEQGTEAISETRRRMDRHPDRLARHPAHLLYLLLDAVVDAYFPAMDAIDSDIDELETAVYGEGTNRRPLDIGPALRLKRRLLTLRQTVAPMRDVLNALQRIDDPDLLPPDLMLFFQDVYDHALRLTEQIDLHRDLLSGVLDAVVAQTGNRLNQVMKTMTAISTILMSAALISGIYGMNFKNMPELDWRWGYGYALGLMVTVAIALVIYFKRIDWL